MSSKKDNGKSGLSDLVPAPLAEWSGTREVMFSAPEPYDYFLELSLNFTALLAAAGKSGMSLASPIKPSSFSQGSSITVVATIEQTVPFVVTTAVVFSISHAVA